jgi:hypothetical protein
MNGNGYKILSTGSFIFLQQDFTAIIFLCSPHFTYFCTPHLVVVAQPVRASDCGSEGRGFESHQPPKNPRILCK